MFDVMDEDLAVADMVLWVGISFEQSASTSYFRRVGSSVPTLILTVLPVSLRSP